MGRKRGRKPTGKVALPLRVDPEIRAYLERQVQRPRVSLAVVAERHLSYAISIVKGDDPATQGFCYLVGELVRISRAAKRKRKAGKFSWRTNRSDFEVFRRSIVRMLNHLAPAGKPPKRTKGAKPPKGLGKDAASVAIGLLGTPAKILRSMSKARPKVTVFYGYPSAAAGLGYQPKTIDDDRWRPVLLAWPHVNTDTARQTMRDWRTYGEEDAAKRNITQIEWLWRRSRGLAGHNEPLYISRLKLEQALGVPLSRIHTSTVVKT